MSNEKENNSFEGMNSENEKYEDFRYPMKIIDWSTHNIVKTEFDKDKNDGKLDMSLNRLPYLEDNGTIISQSKAIERYLARKHKLMGSSEQEAAVIDSLCEYVRDFKDDKYDLYDIQNKFLEIIDDKEELSGLGDIKKEFKNSSVNNIMSSLRQTKDSLEIKLLTKAIKISSLAQIEVMKAIHGEMTEREVQGIHEFIYRKYGAAHEGYNSIVGAGANSCILHYVTNEDINIDNELI